MSWQSVALVVLIFDLFIIYLVLTGPGEPMRKLLWVILVLVVPVLGAILYLLLGRNKPLI